MKRRPTPERRPYCSHYIMFRQIVHKKSSFSLDVYQLTSQLAARRQWILYLVLVKCDNFTIGKLGEDHAYLQTRDHLCRLIES